RDRDETGNQKPLFRFAIGLVLVSGRAVLEPGRWLRRHRNHPKVSIIDSGPLNLTVECLAIDGLGNNRLDPNTFEEPVDGAGVSTIRMDFDGIDALDLAVDHREALGRKRIERVVIDALITGAWANDQTCLGRRL